MIELVELEGRPEMFAGIQGEGTLIGCPVFFVRLARCNLRCSWCDSKFSWEPGVMIEETEIAKAFKKSSLDKLVITGGEPLLQKKGIERLENLIDTNIYIETNGTIEPVLTDLSYIVSPKLSNSGMTNSLNPAALRKFDEMNSVFKFVVETKLDIDEAIQLLLKLCILSTIVFQPFGKLLQNQQVLQELWNYVLRVARVLSFDVRFLPQFHVIVFGQKRGV